MINMRPVERALVPVDSAAAERISGSNYDEFQENTEIWELLRHKPDNILKVTMAHCDVAEAKDILEENSEDALNRAAENMHHLIESDSSRTLNNILWVYEIKDPKRPNIRQIGLGGMMDTQQIRTEDNGQGTIIRNEGVHDHKVQGRVLLVEKTQSMIGTVNLAIEDTTGQVASELEAYADARPCDYSAADQADNLHQIWIVKDEAVQNKFIQLMQAEPYAYVADGNHRSMAAVKLGYAHFLGVCFTSDRMGLAPYNRLVKADAIPLDTFKTCLEPSFEVEELLEVENFQATASDEIGIYTQGTWFRLTPRPNTFDPENSVQTIAADIVQRKLFDSIFGIKDAKDDRLKYVGGNKDAHYLKQKVDDGTYNYAITLAPVTMQQFIDVCQQNRFMPPKSTWFSPKIRSGLIIALL